MWSPPCGGVNMVAVSTDPQSVFHISSTSPVAPSNQPQQAYGGNEQRPWDQHETTKVEFSQEEKQKNWYDLDPERRQQLEVCHFL
jgi:hypothetical protein